MWSDSQVAVLPALDEPGSGTNIGIAGRIRARRGDEADRASRFAARLDQLISEVDSRTGRPYVLGRSAGWRQVLSQSARVAPMATTVLLLGESGTGKEVVARFLHRASSRDRGPFVAINCAALPEQLLEAELFGYERGAFTGATNSKPGQLEQAAGGTLFLDEVGELSSASQAKLLRVLQEREFQRLGGTRVLRSDARIIAATNRDLATAVAKGQFREDLYYRLSVFPIQLPALRQREDDIVVLVEGLLEVIGDGMDNRPAGVSLDARQQLLDHHWPGNVRELRNVLERAAILADGGLITGDHLHLRANPVTPADTDVPPAPSNSGIGTLAAIERDAIERALTAARFNKSRAARILGVTRHQLYVRMRRYGLT